MRRAWLPAGVALVLGLALATGAGAGERLTALDSFEIYAHGFDDLRGIVVDPHGHVFVADRAAGTVTRIAPDRSRAVLARGLQRPIGLALDPAGRLIIAEEKAGRVVRVETDGSNQTRLVTGIKQPRWLATLDDGTVFISARRLTRDSDPEPDDESAEPEMILVLSPTGPLHSPTGPLHVFADGFRGLQGLAVNHGAVFAATQGRRGAAHAEGVVFKIPILADGRAGTPVPLGPLDQFKKPVGLARDRLGALYLTTPEVDRPKDDATHAVAKLHPTAVVTVYAENLEKPQGVAFDQDGNLYVADGSSGRVLRFRAPPAPTVNAPAVTNQSPLVVTGTTLAGARVDVFLNDALIPATVIADSAGAFSASIPLVGNTSNSLEAFATSHGGQGLTSAAAEVTVTHGTGALTLAFLAPPAGAFVSGAISVQARATAEGSGVATLALTVSGRALAATLTPSPPAPTVTATATFNTRAVADGAHTLRAVATDGAGHPAAVSRAVIVDNTPPATQLIDGPDDESPDTGVTFTFTGTDNLTPSEKLLFAWRLDGGAFTTFSAAPTATLTGLAAGTHRFEVTARDLAGNEDLTPAARSFTVRPGPRPRITEVDPPSGPVGTFVTITGTNFEPGATTVAFDGVAAVIRTITATQITTAVPIGATAGPLVVTTSRGRASTTFAVGTTGDFTLTAAPAPPARARVIAGDQVSVSIAAGGSGSFTSLVSLIVSTPPAGITASFSPSTFVAPGASAFVNLVIANTVAHGSYSFTVTGQAQVDGRTLSRTATFSLQVLAPDTHAVTGRVLTAEAVPQPIPGVTVTLGGAFTLTDAGGNFVLQKPPVGANMLLVDGRTASTLTVQYPPVEVNIAVGASGPTRVPFIVYLPKLDTANPVSLPLANGATTQEVKATTPAIPGLVVTIPVGTKITDHDGNPVSQITITPVPIDRSPMPFPPGVTFPMLFTIQPGGAEPRPPLPITFPNARNASPRSKADLWFFDLVAGTWQTWGSGTVSADGTQVVSDTGFGLPRFAWHSYCDELCQAPFSDEAPPAENQPGVTGGEPVDLFTGRFVVRKTDLVLPGRVPVSIERTYWSGLSRVGFFGTGWNVASYDTRLATRGTSLALIQPDQSQLLFAPDGAGQWVNRAAPYMQGAVITKLSDDFIFQLRFKDGTVQRFDRIVGFANVAALSRIVDRNGNTVTITREGSSPSSFGRIASITEPSGRSLTLAYDAANRITSVTDPIGRVVGYAYDFVGRLTTVTDPAGGVTTYAYDASHRIVSITDALGITFITTEYDPNGRVVRQTQADGGVWTFAYTLAGQVVTRRSSLIRAATPRAIASTASASRSRRPTRSARLRRTTTPRTPTCCLP